MIFLSGIAAGVLLLVRTGQFDSKKAALPCTELFCIIVRAFMLCCGFAGKMRTSSLCSGLQPLAVRPFAGQKSNCVDFGVISFLPQWQGNTLILK